jgi:hypothetical protein
MGWGERNEPDWRYLPRSWDTHRQSEEECNFHPSLAISATLTSFILLKPNPSTALGKQIESQDLRDKFLDLLGGKPTRSS